ncbi:hypothetical protein N657DRAFT_713916 [Parathielavia appendiculata]|uniref:Uncharacterized protein n=1 Tax=Parathielavia appendiculata TaxID=2587402 RepID=A0AAN6TPZ4_9PEZI|nr:hypothetical protein N657DRAFT_713916 [Parathielavia appendiculata]
MHGASPSCPSDSAHACLNLPNFVTHVLLPSGSPDHVGIYHNRSTQLIRGISVECLFARFAWSLFTDEQMLFFLSDLKYVVCLWDKTRGETETITLRGLPVKSSAQVFESTRSQSRSVSPKKRSLSTQGDGRVDGGDGYWSDDRDSTSDEHERDGLNEPPRGRPRRTARLTTPPLPGRPPSPTSRRGRIRAMGNQFHPTRYIASYRSGIVNLLVCVWKVL